MGSDYEIECENCGYKTMITIGVGMSNIYNEVKSSITLLSSQKRKVAKTILEDYTDTVGGGSYNVYQCSKCRHIFSRFYLCIFSNNEKVYETKYACPECRSRNTNMRDWDRIKKLKNVNCPKCRKTTLNKTLTLLWD